VNNRDQSFSRLIQLSDSHLFADPAACLAGMNCEEGLRDVLHLIGRDEPELAAVLCTGDLSQDHSMASYRRLQDAVALLGAPQYWIPGNHDEVGLMHTAVGPGNACFTRTFEVPGWSIILLDSSVAGKVSGFLSETELHFLDRHLQQAAGRQVLVCLHHNCVPVAAAWLQQHALQNSEALFEVLDRYTNVRAVLFGHIHQELVQVRRKVQYLGVPSTCIQFHPEHDQFTLDVLNPGYRWLDLFADGGFNTGVKRVLDKRYQVDFSGVGY
jgi:3',5'-cyclic-AMP phosphodiesterase